MDIFELSKADAIFKINGVEYHLHDPVFEKKVDVLKSFEYLGLQNPKTTEDKYKLAVEQHELEREYIACYLPELPREVLKRLGESATSKLFSKLTELATDKFAANIRKIDTEKKPLATPDPTP